MGDKETVAMLATRLQDGDTEGMNSFEIAKARRYLLRTPLAAAYDKERKRIEAEAKRAERADSVEKEKIKKKVQTDPFYSSLKARFNADPS